MISTKVFGLIKVELVTLLYRLENYSQIYAKNNVFSSTPDGGLHCYHPYEKILSHIPKHTRSSDPYVSSLSEKSVPHRYPCEISVINTR